MEATYEYFRRAFPHNDVNVRKACDFLRSMPRKRAYEATSFADTVRALPLNSFLWDVVPVATRARFFWCDTARTFHDTIILARIVAWGGLPLSCEANRVRYVLNYDDDNDDDDVRANFCKRNISHRVESAVREAVRSARLVRRDTTIVVARERADARRSRDRADALFKRDRREKLRASPDREYRLLVLRTNVERLSALLRVETSDDELLSRAQETLDTWRAELEDAECDLVEKHDAGLADVKKRSMFWSNAAVRLREMDDLISRATAATVNLTRRLRDETSAARVAAETLRESNNATQRKIESRRHDDTLRRPPDVEAAAKAATADIAVSAYLSRTGVRYPAYVSLPDLANAHERFCRAKTARLLKFAFGANPRETLIAFLHAYRTPSLWDELRLAFETGRVSVFEPSLRHGTAARDTYRRVRSTLARVPVNIALFVIDAFHYAVRKKHDAGAKKEVGLGLN